MRYEAPSSMNRWDKPLFVVESFDVLPFEEIYEALFNSKAPKPNLATKLTPVTDTNFLYEIDQITQEIVSEILNLQKISMIGDSVSVPKSSKKVVLTKLVTLAELRKIKIQFMNLQKQKTIKDVSKIGDVFVDFLNAIISS